MVGEVAEAERRASPDSGKETRGSILRASHEELQQLFNQLKELGRVQHFFSSLTSEREEGEYYDFNKYGATNADRAGVFEFRIVRQGRHYYLNTQTAIGIGNRWAAGSDPNHIQEETFESDPKSLSYVSSESSKEQPLHGVEKIGVKDGFLSKKGTVEQAKTIQDKLKAAIAKARAEVGIK
ncbi:MAG: hypothetical protein Q7S60_04735 [bacterium]|nr:hypothetical protein [bacterium]